MFNETALAEDLEESISGTSILLALSAGFLIMHTEILTVMDPITSELWPRGCV